MYIFFFLLQIKELEADGICSKSKLLNKGDCLVSCNGNSLHKIPFNQCLNILKSEGPSLTFEVFRKDDIQTTLEFHETQMRFRAPLELLASSPAADALGSSNSKQN